MIWRIPLEGEMLEIAIKTALSILGLSLAFVAAMMLVWMERKVLGRFHWRLGPTEVGRYGLLQLIADGIKLVTKEIVVPSSADRRLYIWAPILTCAIAIIPYALIPYSAGLAVTNSPVGLALIFAFLSMTSIAVFAVSWASGNKLSMTAAIRHIAQSLSSEIPLAISALGVVLLAGSLNLSDIVSAQSEIWFIIPLFPNFLIFLLSGIAELGRVPFDFKEDGEAIHGGWAVDYSGMAFALLLFADYIHLFLFSLLATLLFLGGWSGPLLPPIVWLLLKSVILVYIVMWIRAAYPRYRIDRLVEMMWERVIPLSILTLIWAGIMRIWVI